MCNQKANERKESELEGREMDGKNEKKEREENDREGKKGKKNCNKERK